MPAPIPKLPSVSPLAVPATVTLPEPETVSTPVPSKPTIRPVAVPVWENEPPDTASSPVEPPLRPRMTSDVAVVVPPDWLQFAEPVRPMMKSEPLEAYVPPDIVAVANDVPFFAM